MTKQQITAADVTVVVLAGGNGDRLGSDVPKQYIKLGDSDNPDRMVIDLILGSYAASDLVANILVVAGPKHFDFASEIARPYGARVIVGGATRQESVHLGVQAVETDITLLHDAARPLLHKPALASCIEKLQSGARAVVTRTPPYGSMLLAAERGPVTGVVDRDEIALSQSPGAYHTDDLLEALATATERGVTFRDAPAMMLALRPDIALEFAPGHRSGFKLTYPEDIEVLAVFRRHLDSFDQEES